MNRNDPNEYDQRQGDNYRRERADERVERFGEMPVKDTDRCQNCHREFAEHNYVKDSIDKYKCPVPRQESGYGGFNGGDPRNFHPDYECSTEKERENHRKACDLWDEAEARGESPTPEKCPSGWIFDDNGKAVAHVFRTPYGLGIYTYSYETFFEAREVDNDDEDEE